ncbi:sulfate permease [Xylariales sp. PMI_506]|nr:sulfate permease [Xylariales sp. PMI_506]
MAPSKIGVGLAKAFGIDTEHRAKIEPSEAIHSAADAISKEGIEPYVETDVTVQEWVHDSVPTAADIAHYIQSLFPFWSWIFHYNTTWLFGDFIAGITVGFVAIPQGMAYALLAQLPPQYGLYTSFVGFLLYWIFATSKDITIGTVAVMSTLVGNIIVGLQVTHPEFAPEQIARALSVIAGSVLLFIGLTRLGWIVEFIPLVAITSFMTGAALNIGVGQVPALLGISGINTRESTYKVIINTLKALPRAKLDAAMGLSALAMLYLIRFFCNFMSRRQPNRKKVWFFLGTLRMCFVIILYILISWLVNRNVTDSKKAKFNILGTVPSGFQVHGAPYITKDLLAAVAPNIPSTIIVLLIEHISISKSFGRINNYVINPSQELVAIGFTNILGPFLGAYPATGSFSRTAIKAKAGVRTPLAGIFTAIVVLLALYALTSVFFFIPLSSLAGLIIHAVGDLITPLNTVYQFWQVSPIDVVIFVGGVLFTVFTDLETSVYFTMCASAALLLFRFALTKGSFMGQVDSYSISAAVGQPRKETGSAEKKRRELFVPLDSNDGLNPNIPVRSPYPGVIIYRFNEGFNYSNSGRLMDQLTAFVTRATRPTQFNKYEKIGDRPWNDPGPRRGQKVDMDDSRPALRAIILDCSAVNHLDTTAVQALIDTRNQLDRHAAPSFVEWHLANIKNRWVRRAFAAGGFGYPSPQALEFLARWRPMYSVAATDASREQFPKGVTVVTQDLESGTVDADSISAHSLRDEVAEAKGTRLAAIQGVNRPFFHVSVAAAVESAVANARAGTA